MNTAFHNTIVPVATLILAAAGMLLCTYLFVTCKREIWAVRHSLRDLDKRIEALSSKMTGETTRLDERLEMAEERAGVLVPPSALPSGLNLAKRTQAVRMLRRGAEAGKVARALSLPQPEIELLVRVQALGVNEQTRTD